MADTGVLLVFWHFSLSAHDTIDMRAAGVSELNACLTTRVESAAIRQSVTQKINKRYTPSYDTSAITLTVIFEDGRRARQIVCIELPPARRACHGNL